MESYADDDYKADRFVENHCSSETSILLAQYPLPKGLKYVSSGIHWSAYHSMWSEDNMVSFWNLRSKYNERIKEITKSRSDRRKGKLMPLEEYLLDYSCIGRIIEDNECKNNKKFNMFCGFCKQAMTSSPISKRLAQRFASLIPHVHLAGTDEQILSIGSEETFTQFQKMVDNGRIQIVPCEGINERAHYESIFKASLQDYLVPSSEKESVMIRTHHLYSSLYESYGNVYEKFFKRALRGSANSLMVFHKNKDFVYPKEFKELLEKAKTKRATYIETEADIVNKVIGPHRCKSWDEPQKSLRRNTKAKASDDRYSDTAIKGNWATLMKYCPETWPPHKTKPSCVIDKILEDREFHYIGRSDIKKKKIYFLVSDDMFATDDEKQLLFTKKWLSRMKENIEYNLEEGAKKNY